MRLAIGAVASQFLRRRAVLASHGDGSWRPLDEALVDAGIAGVDAAAHGQLPAAIAFLSTLKPLQRRRLERGLSQFVQSSAESSPLLRPVDDRAKVMIVGGWNPVSRPDLELNHMTPHVMARWMDAEDFKRPPITVFKKFPSAIADPGSDIALPVVKLVRGAPSSGRFEADAVLAVVIGQPALRVSVRNALRHVIGLSLMLDVWDAEIFLEEARVRRGMLSKNLRRVSPLGPWIQVIEDGMLGDELEVTLEVAGQLRQRFCVGDLAYQIAEVISFCSSIGLQPGDIIGFGARIARATRSGPLETPAKLAPGDTIKVAVTEVGTLRARAVAGVGHHG